ncbi:MAG: hypothetical protein ACYDCL_01610 [Myxococcales bacterium]
MAKRRAKRSTAKKAPAKKKAARQAKARRPAAEPKPRQAPRERAAARDAERRRLLREERALERDDQADEEESALPESPEYIPGALEDPLAEVLGEAAVRSEVSGAQAAEDIRDEDLDEDEGGPFVEASAREELARGTDGSNPKDAEPAPFPTTSRTK